MFKISSKRRQKEVKNKLPIAQRAAYGAGHVLNDLIGNTLYSYLIIYLTNVVHLSNLNAGLVMLIGQLADGIFTPFIGIICDRTVCRYGRRKVWHLIGTVVSSATFPLLLTNVLEKDTKDVLKVFYYAGVAIVFQFGWACVQISHLSLIPEIARRKNERVELNAIRSALTYMCGIYIYVVTWILLGQSEEVKITPKLWKEFMYLSFIIVVPGNICNIIFHVVIKEPFSLAYLERLRSSTVDSTASVIPERTDRSVSFASDSVFINYAMDTNTSSSQQQLDIETLPQRNGSIDMARKKSVTIDPGVTAIPRDSVTSSEFFDVIDRNSAPCLVQKSRLDWLKSPSVYKTAVVYTCSRLVMSLSLTYFPYYLTDTLNFEKEAIAYFPLVSLISAVVASILAKPLSKKLGQQITYMAGGAITICACVWFYFQTVDKRSAVYVATVLMGSGGSVMLVTSLSMIADLVGNDKECAAFIIGVIGFIDKCSIGVVIVTIQNLNPREHHVDFCSQCNHYVRHIQSFGPGAATVVGLLTVIVFFKSNFICKLRADCSDSSVQVNFDQPWPGIDDKDNPTTSSIENGLCFNGETDCNGQDHCSGMKIHMDSDTR